MARPLTKIKQDGLVYTRPSEVEAQIDEAVRLSITDLRARLLITDRKDPVYLRHECLIHLVRQGRRSGDQTLMGAVLPVLLSRCEANLLVKVPDGSMSNAADLRQRILDELTELIVADGFGNCPDELDFYECRFNKAFFTLRVDAVRHEAARDKHEVKIGDLTKVSDESQTEDDSLATLSEAFKVLPTQEWDVSRERFLNAIEALPPKEREAVILVHVFGYQEESEDPTEETAATRCNCTGRTIRNRLARAAAKLSRFKEDL